MTRHGPAGCSAIRSSMRKLPRPMPTPHYRARLLAVLTAALVAAAGQPSPALAPSELFFSEYIEGSSNNKALEIFNGTGAAIDLAASAYSVQMFFNGSTTAGLTISLTGTVADGDVFVLAQSSANAAILAQADQTNGAGWFNGDDAVVLRKGGVVIDVIGQIGVDPGTEWGSGLTSTADNTLRRKAAIVAGDTNGSDAFDPSVEWDGFAVDTVAGLGAVTIADTAPAVSATTPAAGAIDVALDANLTVTFNEPVTVTGSWFTLSCTISGNHTAAVSGGPSAFTLNPDAAFVYGDACTLTVLAASVTDQDVSDPPDQMAANVVVTFAPFAVDPCTVASTPIPSIQGSDEATPLLNQVVTTFGVVIGDFEGPAPELRGFYIQDRDGDGNPATSDGVFVFNGNADAVSLGQFVRVTGTAGEFQGQTQLSGAVTIAACGTGTITPTDVTLPFASTTFAERYEGMLVRLPQTLTVTEHFFLGRFGAVVVSSGGRLLQPTDILPPGPEADAVQAANDRNRVIIDDGSNRENPDPLYGPGGLPLSAANTLRAGDSATATVGVMTYTWAGNNASGNAFRVRPIRALGGYVRFDPENPRPLSAPPQPAGTLRVASLNLLNFFNTFSGCRNGLGGAATDCRGADNAAEFGRQWPKTVVALVGSGADVIAINEIENDGYGADSAIAFLIDRLNDATAAGTYAFIDADAGASQVNALGTDAIKVGLIYKPARVTPVGQTAALNTEAFVNGGDSGPRNRASLLQAFEQVGTGARFQVNVNHFKSKGTPCDVPDAGDGQDNCAGVRLAAAQVLAEWLATDPTGVNDPDLLILGDLNSYSKEDPIAHLAEAGYQNLLPAFGGGHSYVFDAQWGSLDHALASPSLWYRVMNAADWFINADEPSALDYNTDFKSPAQQLSLYAPDWFRMADHNPLVVDLALDSDLDARITGGGGVRLTAPAGSGAGDEGSTATFAVNVQFRKSGVPVGHVQTVVRRTEADGVHTYRVKSTELVVVISDSASGEYTIAGRAVIEDITDPSAPILIDEGAAVRFTVADHGEPGIGADTIGIGVWTSDGTLWFSSHWDGAKTVVQPITEGNVKRH
jgi:predicted extracellular nuclease